MRARRDVFRRQPLTGCLALAGLAAVCMYGGAPLFAQQDTANRERFVGNWELVSYESLNRHGQLVQRGMTGRIMYDAGGNMAAQLMPEGQHEWQTVEGYFAYFGTYTVDEENGSVAHHVQGSNIAGWVGTDLVRYFEFKDDTLTLSLKRGETVTGRLVWRRLD